MKNPSALSKSSVKISKNGKRVKTKGKNFFQFLGKGIVTFSTCPFNQQLIETFLSKKSKHLSYPPDFSAIHYKDFREWLFYEDFQGHFNSLESFKRVWSFKKQENSLKNRHFCCVLRRISRYFLENEFMKKIFQKVNSSYLNKDDAHCYLGKVGVVLRLLKSL